MCVCMCVCAPVCVSKVSILSTCSFPVRICTSVCAGVYLCVPVSVSVCKSNASYVVGRCRLDDAQLDDAGHTTTVRTSVDDGAESVQCNVGAVGALSIGTSSQVEENAITGACVTTSVQKHQHQLLHNEDVAEGESTAAATPCTAVLMDAPERRAQQTDGHNPQPLCERLQGQTQPGEQQQQQQQQQQPRDR